MNEERRTSKRSAHRMGIIERRLGRKVGREEGKSIGIEKGIKLVAKRKLEQQMDPTKVAETTGLSLDEIKSLLP